MNSKKLFAELVARIELQEPPEEIKQLVFMVMEHSFKVSSIQILTGTEIDPTSRDKSQVNEIIKRLNRHEPIHYILGKADFFGRSFSVNPSVLIPRPETEELVSLVRSYNPKRALDIGTGSGCIATTLKLELPTAVVFAIDISLEALEVAQKNAVMLCADIEFKKLDILNEHIPFTELDLIVSNPPYVTKDEKENMKSNVVDHEPHLALFVENDDPLLFYKVIAEKSRQALSSGGRIALEINENLGKRVAEVFVLAGYSEVSIHKDINGKDRIVSARYTK